MNEAGAEQIDRMMMLRAIALSKDSGKAGEYPYGVLICRAGNVVAESARLGWQATDVFGVHPIAPSARFDAMGLVPIISGGEVISINERSATIRSPGGQLLVYMRRPSNDAVCLWDRECHYLENDA